MKKPRKPETTPLCPKCGGKLLYDGAGLSCLSCVYQWRRPNPEGSADPKRGSRKQPDVR